MQRMILHLIARMKKAIKIRKRRGKCPDQKRPRMPDAPPHQCLGQNASQENMRDRIHEPRDTREKPRESAVARPSQAKSL